MPGLHPFHNRSHLRACVPNTMSNYKLILPPATNVRRLAKKVNGATNYQGKNPMISDTKRPLGNLVTEAKLSALSHLGKKSILFFSVLFDRDEYPLRGVSGF
ncbi:hypothetical protein KQX54_016047 [Cotesia glomerata]|uniref:Uncharacterized protein n=1 Tax=Cotesia glomerata TaxID=32391 RepID=A0AAV7IPU3_COTGL|nr:hypothetical protein KQX54_016047 [Cotesia glomerata]